MPPFPAPAAVQTPLLVGYSGGLDSTVLLHWLRQSAVEPGIGVRAVHVHHGLQAAADDWAQHCRQQCAVLGVPLAVRQVQVMHQQGLGLEGAAREVRRAAFRDELRDDEMLALAHHRDDQAETFLLRALRGSGVDGLAAMAADTTLQAHRVWRPLLQVPRAELLAYAQAHGLRWIEDPSNGDDGPDRNFLRLHVLPLLRQRWPHADAALAGSAARCGEVRTMLDEEDDALLQHVQAAPRVLDVARLQSLSAARRARVLRRWAHLQGAAPLPATVVAQLEHTLLPATHGSEAQVRWQSHVIRQWRGHWYLLPASLPTLPAAWHTDWDGRAPLALPDGGELQLCGAPAFQTPLQVRPRRGGERIQLPGRGHQHALKDCLQREHLAPWRRAQLPLLFAGDELLAAADVVIAAPLQAWLHAQGARLRWRPGGW